VNSPPPDAEYWVDVGQTVETATGLVQQVGANTADISKIDGAVAAQAAAFQALRAASRDDNGEGELADALKGWTSTAAIATESSVRASQNDATAQRLSNVEVTTDLNTAIVTSLEKAVTTANAAAASKIDQSTTQVGHNNATVRETATALA